MKTAILRFVLTVFVSFASLGADVTPPAGAPPAVVAPPPPPAPAKAAGDGLLYISTTNGFSLRLDPKTIADGGAIGLDYEVGYKRPVTEEDGVFKKVTLELEGNSRGFIATKKLDSQDSLVTELKFNGKLALGGGRRSPWDQVRYNHLTNLLQRVNDPFKLTEAESREWKEFQADEPKRFAIFDGHVKHEADQSFKDQQFATGVGFSSDLDLLTGNNWPAKIFDALFSLTRSAEVNSFFAPRSPRFYVGYDYVDAGQNKDRKSTGAGTDLNRLMFQAAWNTIAFDKFELRASFQSYYEIGASSLVKSSGKEWLAFTELTAAFPFDAQGRKKIIIKYANGELPPTSKEASNVALGLSFELGGR